MSRAKFRAAVLTPAVFAVLHVSPVLATSIPVDFTTFTSQEGVPAASFVTPNWVANVTTYNNIAVTPGRVAQETTNSDTTFFVGPSSLTTLNKVITGDIYFGNDDDYVGLAFGMPQDPFTNTAANYFLLEWKGATQTTDFHDSDPTNPFHNSTVGGSAPAGLSLSQVTGVPTADEFWQRSDLTMYNPGSKTTPDPANDPPLGYNTGGLTELARAATLGSTSYDRAGNRTSFSITYTSTNITVSLTPHNGTAVTQFNYTAPAGTTFPDGTLGLYEQSQDGNGAFAYFDVRDIGDPAPTGNPDLSPAGFPYSAGDISVPNVYNNAANANNTASPWSVVRTTTSDPMSIVSAANVADVDLGVDANRISSGEGVVLATVRQNGPRTNSLSGSPDLTFYGGVEAAAPSGFGSSTGLATFPFGNTPTASGPEWNMNVAAVHLPYTDFHAGYVSYDATTNSPIFGDDKGAKAGVVDNPSLYTLTAVHLALPTQVKYDPNNFTAANFWLASAGNGPATNQVMTNLAISGKHAATGPGLLFTIGTSNENNYTGAAVLPNGSWNISVRDSFKSSFGGPDTFEADNFAFAYIEPGQIAESVGARVTSFAQGSPTVAQTWGNYTLDHVRPGVYELVIPGGETYTINALQLTLTGSITLGTYDTTTTPITVITPPVNNQTLVPTLADTSFSVAFLPFNPGDPSTGMLLLENNGTLVMKNSTSTQNVPIPGTSNTIAVPVTGPDDVTAPTAFYLTYQVGGVPTWKSTASAGNFNDPANYRVGAPASTDSVNFSHENTGPTTVNITAPATVANLYFNSPSKYTLAGSALTITGELGSFGGSHEITAPITASNTSLLVGPGASLKLTGALTGKLSNLSVSPTGTLDLTSNTNLIIDYTGSSPAISLRQALQAGRASGDWSGAGITSSTTLAADSQHRKAIAYAEASDLLGLTGADTANYNGQTVDATTLITKLTWLGDANLDGRINADDYALLDRGYAKALTGWLNGDFNYDGIVDQNDYLLIDRVVTLQSGTLSPSLLAQPESQFGEAYVSELVSSIPEPASLGLLIAAALPMLRRRRHD